jgi:transposase-like protein
MPIPPEIRKQYGTWPCPFCGAQNKPEECTEDGCHVKGVCSACAKIWEKEVEEPVKPPEA